MSEPSQAPLSRRALRAATTRSAVAAEPSEPTVTFEVPVLVPDLPPAAPAAPAAVVGQDLAAPAAGAPAPVAVRPPVARPAVAAPAVRALAPDDQAEEARTVRPYAVTGGRVRAASSDLPLEALVEALPAAAGARGLPPEKRAILQHSAHTFVSVAELSALLRLPLGVVRVLVTDLAGDGVVRVHTSTPVSVHTGQSPALSLSVLESVLNGISAL